MTRPTIAARILLAVLIAALFALTGCSAPPQPTNPEPPASETATGTPAAVDLGTPIPIKIGTLPTEDSLPLWIAEERAYFAVNKLPKVEIISFQSAQERDAAFASGAIDAFMGDIIAATNLEAAGTGTTIETIMLGSNQSEGRFGVAVPKGSTAVSMANLKGVPIGTSSATIQEYVLDGLAKEGGLQPQDVKIEEVKKVPVRFELLMAGKLKAAALPEPFLSLVEQSGGKLVGDDTRSNYNLSQTVLVFSDKYLAKEGGEASAQAVLDSWDSAVAEINVDPNAYRQTLVDKARLPAPLAETYQVNTYPTAQVPNKALVTAVLDWMRQKGYLKADVTYEDLVPAEALPEQ
jgi:NitT/TauT family transport system substrate-binding protein